MYPIFCDLSITITNKCTYHYVQWCNNYLLQAISPTVFDLMTHDVTVNEGGGSAEVCVELVNEIEGSLAYATRDVENGATGIQ